VCSLRLPLRDGRGILTEDEFTQKYGLDPIKAYLFPVTFEVNGE